MTVKHNTQKGILIDASPRKSPHKLYAEANMKTFIYIFMDLLLRKPTSIRRTEIHGRLLNSATSSG